MREAPFTKAEDDKVHHTYATHRIPWYVRAMWLVLWIVMIWYIVAFAIPSARDYYRPPQERGSTAAKLDSPG